MAKHCDVCNKSYPESEVRCPHCAATAAGSDVNPGEPYLAEQATPPPAGGEPFVAEAASNVDLAGGPFVADVADDSASAVDLAALAGQAAGGSSFLQSGSSAKPAADKGEAATEVDAGAAPPQPGAADTHFLDDAAEVEAGSSVNLGEATRPTDRPSSRDLIAEAVESGIDLAAARAAAEVPTELDAPEGKKPPGRQDTDPDDDESGSDRVDLGSHETPALTTPSGPSSEVDLAGRAGRARRRAAASEPASDVDLGAARAEGEEAEERPEDEAAPGVAREERPARRARAGVGRLLVGGGVGLLVGVGLTFVLWLFGVEPPAGWRLAEAKGPSGAVRPQPEGPRPGPGAVAPAAADPAEQLRRGDFARAVEGFKSAEVTPQVQAQRGTARWLAYLQEQKAKDAALRADDEAVKQARADLEAARKDNAEALLALGNLQEWTGAPAEAVATYQDGLKRFGNNVKWARAFQAQLDRLESTSAAPAEGGQPRADAGRPGASAAEALVALVLAFQAGQPDQGAAADDDEAGYAFWAAVKSAKAGDYAAALKSLEAARKAHDKLRFSRLRKAQNPLSDPTEEIFLRSAKEIEAYWTLQNYLRQQNIVAKGEDPQKAIATAVQQSAALQAQLKKAADALGTTPDKLGAAADTLVKQRDEAARKATALTTDLAAAKKDAEAARKEAKDAGDKLAQAGEQMKAAEGRLKNVGDRLAAAGVKEADPARGIDVLAAERTAADKALGAVADRLAGANVRVGKKDVVQGVERLVRAARQNGPGVGQAPRRPRSADEPNPLLGYAHYADGLRAYFADRFADAESAFLAAVEADDQDARYFYFLGLSRLAQDRPAEAAADFEDGARLERENRPGRKAVTSALERIQGPARQVVNRFRP